MFDQMQNKLGSNIVLRKQINLPLDKVVRVDRGNKMFFANEYFIKGDQKLTITKIEKRKITPQIQ